jgi:hypothetical protein
MGVLKGSLAVYFKGGSIISGFLLLKGEMDYREISYYLEVANTALAHLVTK